MRLMVLIFGLLVLTVLLLINLTLEVMNMANTQADLDTALTSLGNDIGTLVAEVPLLIAKIQANPTGDFTTEIAAMNSMAASVQNAIALARPITGQ